MTIRSPMTRLFQETIVLENPRISGEINSHPPRSTIAPRTKGTLPAANVSNTTATPTVILSHRNPEFRAKPNANGDTITHNPIRIFAQSARVHFTIGRVIMLPPYNFAGADIIHRRTTPHGTDTSAESTFKIQKCRWSDSNR